MSPARRQCGMRPCAGPAAAHHLEADAASGHTGLERRTVTENHRVQWTRDGRRWMSAVSYGLTSAAHRQAHLGANGATDIEIAYVKPGA